MKQLSVLLVLILVTSCSKKQVHRLKEEVKIKGADTTGDTLKLRLAALEQLRGGEFDAIKTYLNEGKFRANSIINTERHTFLRYASGARLENTVQILVENEEKGKLMEAIRANNDYKQSPLYIAVKNGHLNIVRRLIYGRAIRDNGMKECAEEAIECAAVKAMLEVVRNLEDQDNRTLLHWAALTDDIEILQLITEFMAIAAEKKENDLVDTRKRPLSSGNIMEEVGYVNKKDREGNTALALAASNKIAAYLQKIKKPSAKEWDQKIASKSYQESKRIREAWLKRAGRFWSK